MRDIKLDLTGFGIGLAVACFFLAIAISEWNQGKTYRFMVDKGFNLQGNMWIRDTQK